MSERMYLTGFRAQDFRCFGSVELAFEASPGIVILVGPNGLGKTSWFEAVEIALTGEVARWQDIKKRTGVRPVPERHGTDRAMVHLAFGGQSFDESPALWDSAGKAPASVESLLCANPQAWGLTPKNVAGFLRATHIFPQSAAVRPLHKPPVDRWEQILRYVSGFDQLYRLSENLGPGVLRAVTSIVHTRESERLDRADELVRWQQRIEKLRSAELSSKHRGDVLAPLEAARLLAEEGDVDVRVTGESVIEGDGLRSAIDSKIGALKDQETKREDDLVRLEDVSTLPAAWKALGEETRLLDESVSACQRALARLGTLVSDASLQVGHGESSHNSLIGKRDAVLQELRQIDELLAIQHQHNAAGESAADAAGRTVAAQERYTVVEKRSLEISAISERRIAWDLVGGRIREQKERIQTSRLRISRFLVLEKQLHGLAQELAELESAKAVLGEKARHLDAEVEVSRATRIEAENNLEEIRQSSESIQDAVSRILECLKPDDHECPVCRAVYSGEGDLVLRARAAVSGLNPLLGQAEAALRERVLRLEYSEARLRDVASQHDGIVVALNAARRLRDELSAEVALFRSDFPLLSEAGAESLDAEAQGIAARESVWLREGENFPAPEVLESLLMGAKAERDEAKRHLDTACEEERQAAGQVEGLAARQKAYDAIVSCPVGTSLGVWRESVAARLLSQESDLLGSQVLLAEARSALEQRQSELRACRVESLRASSRREDVNRIRETLIARWAAAGFGGEPDAVVLAGKINYLQVQRATLLSTSKVLRRIGERLDAWLKEAELRNERAVLGVTAGGADDEALDAYTAHLDEKMRKAEEMRGFAEKAHSLAKQLSDASAERKASFCKLLQGELEGALKDYLPLLIKDSSFHDIVATIETSKRSTSFVPHSSDGYQIEARASEGQLSGLGFGVQLAMASSFPWSRWRGLLLDDPLQYSDIVHTSNLVEVLRMLALQHGFQVFLSTHEKSLADYVFRKFRNAGLSAERIVFREPADGAGGVPIHLR